MADMLRAGALALLAITAATATPATAALPEPVRAMIDAAIETGDAKKVATVIEIARATNPDDASEIDAIAEAFAQEQARAAKVAEAEKEQEIRAASLFENWKGRGQLGAFRATGNSSNTGLSAALKLERNGIDWRHKLTVIADYQRSNGITTREQFRFGYEPNYRLSERLYTYGLAQYEHDRFQGFEARYSLSAGLGYDVIDEKTIKLSLDGGPAYRSTELSNGERTEQVSGRAALDLDWQVADSIKFVQDATAFLRSDNSTFRSSSGLEFKINGSLSTGLAYVFEHETDPPGNALKTDTLSRVTLIYDF